jgi:hypothetical protein
MSDHSDSSVDLLEKSPEGDEEREYALTAKDRCDSCRSQAYYMVSFESGDLYFCRHHYNKYYPNLYSSKLVTDVLDESEKLFPQN